MKVFVTVNISNTEELDLEFNNVTNLNELEDRLLTEYPTTQSWVFVGGRTKEEKRHEHS